MTITLEEHFKGFAGSYRHGDKFALNGITKALFHLGRNEWCFVDPSTFEKSCAYSIPGIGTTPSIESIVDMAGEGVSVVPVGFTEERKLRPGSIITSTDGETSLILSYDFENDEYAFVDLKDGSMYTEAVISDSSGMSREHFRECGIGAASEWIVRKLGGDKLII